MSGYSNDAPHHRSWSPDHFSGGSRNQPNPYPYPYSSGAIPPPSPSFYEPHRAPPPLSHPQGVPAGRHRSRSRDNGALLPAPHHHHHHPHSSRSRSHLRNRSRSSSRSSSSSSNDTHNPKTPLSKARHVLNHSFSSSTSGLGVGVLGAIVGGLAAREASEAAAKKGHHGHGTKGGKDGLGGKEQLISTIVGAAVGGLGANAIEKRLEVSRRKTSREQEDWERKWGKESGSEGRRSGDRERDREWRDVEEGRGRRRESRVSGWSGEDSDWEDLGRRQSVSRKRY